MDRATKTAGPQRDFDYSSWGDDTALAVHPHDDGVRLGAIGALHHLPDDVDAVVSLCRLGATEPPTLGIEPANDVEVWLIDRPDPAYHAHLDFVLHDAVQAVAALRSGGRTVLVHCVQAQSRTPAVGVLYSALACGVPVGQALADVRGVLPYAVPYSGFVAALERLAGGPR